MADRPERSLPKSTLSQVVLLLLPLLSVNQEEVCNLSSAQKIVDELKKWNVTHAIGLPDNGTARIYEQLHADAEIDVITVTREGEAFAIASGLYVGGKQPVVIIQNTGLLESGDAIRGTAFNMKSSFNNSRCTYPGPQYILNLDI